MNVLVYGGNGWIGTQFIEFLQKKKINYMFGNSRVDHDKSLEQEIKNYKPTNIISFIGRTHGLIDNEVFSTIDYLEQEGKLTENIRDNLYSPLILAILCKKHNIHLTYMGTGCIFECIKEKKSFNEDDNPNFFGSSYSIVKGFTDRIMKKYSDTVLNLRIRMPITDSPNPRNFITKITSYKKICSMANSMTVLPDMIPIIFDMMEKKTIGTINLTNPGVISHNEILKQYKEIVDPTFEWINMTSEEQNSLLYSKRSNNSLNTDKLLSLYPGIKTIHKSIIDILNNYKKNRIKTLFVTGGCGFIGSNFINNFFKNNQYVKIINYDCLYYAGKEENINKEIRESDRYTFINGNLRSKDLLKYIFSNRKITHIIHFAAQSHVESSFTDSLTYTDDNIVGTHTLLESCRLFNKHILKFIHVSTDEVYGESELDIKKKKTEISILCPTNPYAATKAGAEMLVQSYCNSFNFPAIITRGNNVFGPNQYPEKVIPKFISLLKQNKKITIQGDGSCIRGFLHTYDTSNAFEIILKKGLIGEIYNIGCDKDMEYSILQIAELLIKKIKGNNVDKKDWITYIEDRPFNDKRYYIDNNKLKDLGWNPSVSFEDGINNLI